MGRAAALRPSLSSATGARWTHQVMTKGHAEAAPQRPPRGKGSLAPYQYFPEEPSAQDPDITLFESCDALAEADGVQMHRASIANLLSRLLGRARRNQRLPPCAPDLNSDSRDISFGNTLTASDRTSLLETQSLNATDRGAKVCRSLRGHRSNPRPL